MGVSKAVASLTITNFKCDPVEITNELEVEPSKVWRHGEPILSVRPEARKHQENGWRLTVEITSGGDDASLWLCKAVEKLMNAVTAKLPHLKRLPTESLFQVSCYLRVGEEAMPVINFNKEVIRLIAAIGASIDVDIVVDA